MTASLPPFGLWLSALTLLTLVLGTSPLAAEVADDPATAELEVRGYTTAPTRPIEGHPSAPPVSLLDQRLGLYVIRRNVSEITRELRLHLGDDFRWAYPASAPEFLRPYVTLDTRDDPQALATVLDRVCAEAGLAWRLHDDVIIFLVPLSDAETQAMEQMHRDERAPYQERIRAARRLANAGHEDAMVWLFRQLRGTTALSQLESSELFFIGERVRRGAGPDALLSPYLLVGDHPEVVAVVRELLQADESYGLSLAVAAGITALEADIVATILDHGRGSPAMDKSQAARNKRFTERFGTSFSFDAARDQLSRLQDQYLRVVASDEAMEPIIAALPTSKDYFRARLINNLGLRRAAIATQALETIANEHIEALLTQPDDASRIKTANELRWALQGLLRRGAPGWQVRITGLFDTDTLPTNVQEQLLPALRWDTSPASAAILGRYGALPMGPYQQRRSSVSFKAVTALNHRRDIHAFKIMKQLLTENGPTAIEVAQDLAFRHDEEAARYLAAAAMMPGPYDVTWKLAQSRLPWVVEVMEGLVYEGKPAVSKAALNYVSAHRSSEASSLPRRIAQADGPAALRLLAMRVMDGNSRDQQNWQALQVLIDDPNTQIREQAVKLLTTGFFARNPELRAFVRRKAVAGHLEATAQLSAMHRRTEGTERAETLAVLNTLAASASPDLRRLSTKQLQSIGQVPRDKAAGAPVGGDGF